MYVWVYILQSHNNYVFTVGAARNLVRAFELYEYRDSPDFPCILIATYRVYLPEDEALELGADHPLCTHLERDITLKVMKRQGSRWYKVCSQMGIYNEHSPMPKELIYTSFPILCYCGVPAELRKGQDGNEYYSCPRRSRDWTRNQAFPRFIVNRAANRCGFYAKKSFFEVPAEPMDPPPPPPSPEAEEEPDFLENL